jgi:hypothetical protein
MKSTNSSTAWWRFGHVWMVVLGPAIVVVASFVTYYLAAKAQDPVINTQAYVAADDAPAASRSLSEAPAMQARNHAATGVMPESKEKK